MVQTFHFVSTNVDFTLIPNDYAPVLSSGMVVPANGTPSDNFNFTVIYTDQDNNTPFNINVFINGTSYVMYKNNPLDNDYTDGCLYEYTTYLNEELYNYTYMFQCSDGIFTNATSTYTDLKVNGENFFTPVLSNPTMYPSRGYNGTTEFIFKIEYTDADNDKSKLALNSIDRSTVEKESPPTIKFDKLASISTYLPRYILP